VVAIGAGDVMLIGHVNEDIQGLILKVVDIKNTVNALTRIALGALTDLILCQIIFITYSALREVT
jgi:hypothetical protein